MNNKKGVENEESGGDIDSDNKPITVLMIIATMQWQYC